MQDKRDNNEKEIFEAFRKVKNNMTMKTLIQ